MPKPSTEQRIATLEKALQALAEDYSKAIYGHSGPVEWQEGDGWLQIVPNANGEMPDRTRVLGDA